MEMCSGIHLFYPKLQKKKAQQLFSLYSELLRDLLIFLYLPKLEFLEQFQSNKKWDFKKFIKMDLKCFKINFMR